MKGLLKLLGLKKIKKYSDRDKRRSFTRTQRVTVWYNQFGKCNICTERLDWRSVVFDHIIRWADGGLTEIDNCQALCGNCHNRKGFDEAKV